MNKPTCSFPGCDKPADIPGCRFEAPMHNTALKDETFCSIECKSRFLANLRRERRMGKNKEAHWINWEVLHRLGKVPWHLFQFGMGYLGTIEGGEIAKDRFVDDFISFDMFVASDREAVQELVAERLAEFFEKMEGYGDNIPKREKTDTESKMKAALEKIRDFKPGDIDPAGWTKHLQKIAKEALDE